MTMLKEFRTVGSNEKYVVKLGKNVFANSLIDALIQDSSKRERSVF